MNVVAELYGGPYDGGSWPLDGIPCAPPALVFSAAHALAGWHVTTISETRYGLAETISNGSGCDVVRYRHEP